MLGFVKQEYGWRHFTRNIRRFNYLPSFNNNKIININFENDHSLNMNNDVRWNYVFNQTSKIKRCGEDSENGCGCKQPFRIKKQGLATLIADWDPKLFKDIENFDEKKLDFIPSIYVWSGGSYIAWDSDIRYAYNGTIYLNEEWDSNNGGVFLYKDNLTNEIKGIEPSYNSMVVNFSTEDNPHNYHCVTCIVPGTIKKRVIYIR